GKPFKSFEAFCTHPLWQGLELTVDELLGYLKKSPAVKALVLGELEEQSSEVGARVTIKDNGDNITVIENSNKPKRGTSPTYLSKRLKRDNPELFDKVKSGELTAHAAAIVAGFKKPMVQVRTDDVNKAIEKLLNHYDLDELQRAVMSYGVGNHDPSKNQQIPAIHRTWLCGVGKKTVMK
ncbi:MAG: hypothetical protein HQK65_13360, partial [Desulfamplus sp.]|nr:hypothetical protein [Desulfamplus sp.]